MHKEWHKYLECWEQSNTVQHTTFHILGGESEIFFSKCFEGAKGKDPQRVKRKNFIFRKKTTVYCFACIATEVSLVVPNHLKSSIFHWTQHSVHLLPWTKRPNNHNLKGETLISISPLSETQSTWTKMMVHLRQKQCGKTDHVKCEMWNFWASSLLNLLRPTTLISSPIHFVLAFFHFSHTLNTNKILIFHAMSKANRNTHSVPPLNKHSHKRPQL